MRFSMAAIVHCRDTEWLNRHQTIACVTSSPSSWSWPSSLASALSSSSKSRRSSTPRRWARRWAHRPRSSAPPSPRSRRGRARSPRSAASRPSKGVAVSNEVAGRRHRHPLRVGRRWCKQGQVLVELDTSVERAQLASAAGAQASSPTHQRRSLARARRRATRSPRRSSTPTRPQLKTVERRRRRAAGADRAQDRARAVRRPARHPRRQPRPVPEPGHRRSPSSSRSTRCSSTSRCRSSTSRDVTVGMPVRVAIEGVDGAEPRDGTIAAIDPSVDSHDAHASSCAPACPTSERQAAPRHVRQRRASSCPSKAAVVAVPLTAVVHASYGDSVFVVEDKKDDAGRRETGPTASRSRSRASSSCGSGESRGDFVAVARRREGRPRGRDRRRLQAAQRRARRRQQQRRARARSSHPQPENR